MADDDRMDGVLRRQLRVADAAREIALPRPPLGAKHMPARMAGGEAFQRRHQPVRQRVIGRIHAGKQRVAAGLRHLAGIEHRAQGRHLVVAVVGVPAAADVARLLRLLPDLGDHWIAGDGGEKAVDVNRRKPLGKRDMLLRRELLVAEKDDAVLPEGAADLGENSVVDRPGEIDATYLGADMR